MAEESKKIIQAELVDQISADLSDLFPPKDIQILLNKTIELQDKVIKLNDKWQQSVDNTFSQMQAEGSNSRTGAAYKTLGTTYHSDVFQYQDILAIIIETELFIDKVREFFTGQTITFAVGVSYYGKLYEYNLSLLDMLKTATIGIDSKTQNLKLRIAKSKTALINAYGEANKQDSTIESDKAQKITNEELYNSLHNYWEEHDKRIGGKYVNEGQLYETYRYFLAEGKGSFDESAPADQDFLVKAAYRSLNSVSGRKGGDVKDAQVKFYNASFATLTNIKNTLTELRKLLENFVKKKDAKEFSAGVKNLFTKNQKDIEEIDGNMYEEAEKHIDKVISALGITIK